MSMSDLAAQIEAAVRGLGRDVRRVVLLSPPDPRKRGRSTWRVALAEGGSLKARVLESEAAARELVELRAGLEPAFVPALACRGPVLVEQWIEGELLAAGPSAARAAEAGALLGRLHARPVSGAPATVPTDRWRAQAENDLDLVLAAGELEPREARVLRERLARDDPGRAPTALIHRDFCAENMLVDPAGRLHVIDNEWFLVDAVGLDLGRTLHRWPLPPAARDEFLAAYRDSARHDPGPPDFWILFSVLWSARIRLDQPPARRAEPLEAARRIAEGSDPNPPG